MLPRPMLIEINRFYKSTNFESHVMYNTRYIKKIEEYKDDNFPVIKSRIVYDGDTEEQIIYSADTYRVLKNKCKKK